MFKRKKNPAKLKKQQKDKGKDEDEDVYAEIGDMNSAVWRANNNNNNNGDNDGITSTYQNMEEGSVASDGRSAGANARSQNSAINFNLVDIDTDYSYAELELAQLQLSSNYAQKNKNSHQIVDGTHKERTSHYYSGDPFNSQLRKSTLRRNGTVKEPAWPSICGVPFTIRNESKTLLAETRAILNDPVIESLDKHLKVVGSYDNISYDFNLECAFLHV